MWAWVSTRKSIAAGSKGKSLVLSSFTDRLPWYRPQSIRKRASSDSISEQDPVTVPAAP